MMAANSSNVRPMVVPCPAVVSSRIIAVPSGRASWVRSIASAMRAMAASTPALTCAPGWLTRYGTPSRSQRPSSSSSAARDLAQSSSSGEPTLIRYESWATRCVIPQPAHDSRNRSAAAGSIGDAFH